MNTEVKKLEKSMVEIKAVFDTEEWAAAQEKALNKLAGSVKLDGFRKGHAPKNLIKGGCLPGNRSVPRGGLCPLRLVQHGAGWSEHGWRLCAGDVDW